MNAALDGASGSSATRTATGRSPATACANANSTGLAAQALLAAGREKAAAKANAFLRSLQVGCGGKPANRGLVHYAKHTRR